MAITQDRADDSPRKEPAPRQTASIVEHALTGDQQHLGEHNPAVLAVERGHRVLVAPTDPAQQLNVVAGTVVTGGEGHRTGIPVRIVHL
jgi:hypothetical protein